ncbi:MAG: NAD(P)H-binding protein [Nitrospiraceae bacterium]|nr:NAD(P)H-binding protein [Nitrospiraceae bacterium]
MSLQHSRATRPKWTCHTKNLYIFKGDVLHPGEVDAAVKGQDAVLSALGLTKGSPKTICADGIRNIMAVMKKYGVKRLLVLPAP